MEGMEEGRERRTRVEGRKEGRLKTVSQRKERHEGKVRRQNHKEIKLRTISWNNS